MGNPLQFQLLSAKVFLLLLAGGGMPPWGSAEAASAAVATEEEVGVEGESFFVFVGGEAV